MLSTLRIKNLALVSDLTVDFQSGFNAITGETGAGKSILIGALNLVLGERADRTLIRGGAENCSVEAVMDISGLQAPLSAFLEENGLEPCEDNQLVLKRIFTSAGANRQFINGSPTTQAVLKSLGEWLVDIHGPHEHQSLLHPNRQLAILDAYGKLEKPRTAFAALVRRRTELESQKASLIIDERTYAQQLDLLRHQVHEIAAAKLQPGEAENLEQDYQRAHNAARLIELGQTALGILSEDDSSIFAQMGSLGRVLQDLQRVDPSTSSLTTLQGQVTAGIQDLQRELSHYLDRIELDPAHLQTLEERINLLHSLKRKYGATVEEVIAFGEAARQKLQQLEQREEELARIQADIQRVDHDLWRVGQDLSAQRKKAAPTLCKAVTKQLGDLGFKQSSFTISITTLTPQTVGNSWPPPSHGLDTIEFQFAPNIGEPVRPLRAIASSGEMARVMLAIKTVLAVEDEVPVLIFDEVDANVGGETAQAVGMKMRQIGRQRQVLCVTHLAPVAASAVAHYQVSKQIRGGRTLTEIRRLDKEERVLELTRMLGGPSEAAQRHAEALLSAQAGI